MNPWAAKSIEIVASSDYLDRIYSVYPFDYGQERDLPSQAQEAISRAFRERNPVALVSTLLSLERFPVEHPFAAVLKQAPELFARNPNTVRRIGEHLLEKERSTLISLSMKPKPPNTKVGPMFEKWVPSLGYPVVPRSEFEKSSGTEAVFLKGANPELLSYANEVLHCAASKGVDFVLRIGATPVVGTAKWIGSPGGNQQNSFTEAMRFLGSFDGEARRMAVIDGYPWTAPRGRSKGTKMQRAIRNTDGIVMSALLLKEFIHAEQATATLRR